MDERSRDRSEGAAPGCSLGQQLPGSWLLSWWKVSEDEPSGVGAARSRFPFGRRPSGLLIYAPDGFMSAAVSMGKRQPLPPGKSPRRIQPRALAEAFTSYFHYSGRWRVEGATVIHDVTSALNPNLVGTSQTRLAEVRGDELLLTGIEPLGDRQRRHELLWRRASGPAEPGTGG